MPDYPVLDGTGAVLVPYATAPGWVKPPKYDASKDYPVRDGSGNVILAFDVVAPPAGQGWLANWTALTRIVDQGHSLTDDKHDGAYPGSAIAIRNSLMDPDDWGTTYLVKATIPGSATPYRWAQHLAPRDDPQDFDVLIMVERGLDTYGVSSPDPDGPTYADFKEDIQGTLDYALNQIDNGGDNKVIMYAAWASYLDNNGPFRETTLDYTFRYKWRAEYLTWKCKQLRPDLPSDWRVAVLPGNLMLLRMWDDAEAGRIPGLTKGTDVFLDDIHLNEIGGYGIAILQTTMGWGVDLRTRPETYVPEGVTQEQAEYLKGAAWDIISTFEPAGKGGTQYADKVFDPATDQDPLGPVVIPEPEGLPTDFVVEMSATDYTGPSLTPALPAATNGYRTFNGTSHAAALSFPEGYYAVMAIRSLDWAASGYGQAVFLSPSHTTWDKPNYMLNHGGSGQMYSSAHEAGQEYPEGAMAGRADAGEWAVVEAWISGTTLYASLNGGAVTTTEMHGPVQAVNGLRLFESLQAQCAYIAMLRRTPTTGERTACRAKAMQEIAKVSDDPLKQFYDSGTIVTAYDSDHVTMSGADVVLMKNKAQDNPTTDYSPVAVGAVTAIAKNGNDIEFTPTSGYLKSAKYVEFIGNRVMMAVDFDDVPVTGTRLLGKSEGSGRFEVYLHVNTSAAMTVYLTATTGTAVTVQLSSTNRAPAAAGRYLIEIEGTASEFSLYINGDLLGTTPHTLPLFHTNRISIGAGGNSSNRGTFGLEGLYTVAIGRPDTDAAIAAARAAMGF